MAISEFATGITREFDMFADGGDEDLFLDAIALMLWCVNQCDGEYLAWALRSTRATDQAKGVLHGLKVFDASRVTKEGRAKLDRARVRANAVLAA